MDKDQLLNQLTAIQEALADMPLSGDSAQQRDRLVERINDTVNQLVLGGLKEDQSKLNSINETLAGATKKLKETDTRLTKSESVLKDITSALDIIVNMVTVAG